MFDDFPEENNPYLIMKANFLFLLVLFIIISSSSVVFALDGNRKGFIIGIGAGASCVNMDFESPIKSEFKTGLATSLKIGGGISNQFVLYYVRNASWISYQIETEAYSYKGQKEIFVTGISGLGVTYYFSPESPSWYFLGAIGIGDVATPFADDSGSESGSAFMAGGGYEFSPHAHVEGTILMADIDDVGLKTNAFQMSVNYLWY